MVASLDHEIFYVQEWKHLGQYYSLWCVRFAKMRNIILWYRLGLYWLFNGGWQTDNLYCLFNIIIMYEIFLFYLNAFSILIGKTMIRWFVYSNMIVIMINNIDLSNLFWTFGWSWNIKIVCSGKMKAYF